MPICKQITINKDCQLLVWKLNETLNDLLQKVDLEESEIDKLSSFGSNSRKLEFVASRCLVQSILGKDVRIKNNEHGKPYLLNSSLNISISHTKKYVGILLGKNYSVALDMEYLSDRVERIASRFLSEKELNSIANENRILHLYQHWCAKECLIKLYGKKDVHLTNELIIDSFQPSDNSFTGKFFRKDFSERYIFKHLQFDGQLLVYATKSY